MATSVALHNKEQLQNMLKRSNIQAFLIDGIWL